ncbi:MAG: hypothetical protein IIZ39_07500 [Blautia sp.]|nr:hypothetical protein [Blautia sp.]
MKSIKQRSADGLQGGIVGSDLADKDHRELRAVYYGTVFGDEYTRTLSLEVLLEYAISRIREYTNWVYSGAFIEEVGEGVDPSGLRLLVEYGASGKFDLIVTHCLHAKSLHRLTTLGTDIPPIEVYLEDLGVTTTLLDLAQKDIVELLSDQRKEQDSV